jgi:hypothetical protein
MKMILAALLASTVAVSTAAAASAPVDCEHVVKFDTVFQTGSGSGFDYFFQIRNTTQRPVTLTVGVGRLPANVHAFSPNLPGISLGPNENKRIKFASGSNNQINDGVFDKSYEHPSSLSKKAYVVAMGCKQ